MPSLCTSKGTLQALNIFRCTEIDVLLSGLDSPLEVVEPTRMAPGRYQLDLPVLVDDDVLWPDITHLLVYLLELLGCPDHVKQQVPHFGLQEGTTYRLPIVDFPFQDKGIIFKE